LAGPDDRRIVAALTIPTVRGAFKKFYNSTAKTNANNANYGLFSKVSAMYLWQFSDKLFLPLN